MAKHNSFILEKMHLFNWRHYARCIRHSKFCVYYLSHPVCSTLLQEPRQTNPLIYPRLGAENADNLERAMGPNKKAPAESALSRQKTRKGAAEQGRKPLDNNHSNWAKHHRATWSPSPTTPAKVGRAPRFPPSTQIPHQSGVKRAAEQQHFHPSQQVRRHHLRSTSGD